MNKVPGKALTKLERNDFKGIKLYIIENYIDKIKKSLNVNMPYIHNQANAVSYLIDFLNDNNFVQNEGSNINDETINSFISRLNRKINPKVFDENNFLTFNKEMTRNKPV